MDRPARGDHRELVPVEPDRQVTGGNGLPEPTGGLDQHGVANDPPVHVVDPCHAVETEHENDPWLGPFRDGTPQFPAVGQGGELVGEGSPTQRPLQRPTVAHVPDVRHQRRDRVVTPMVADPQLDLPPAFEPVAQLNLVDHQIFRSASQREPHELVRDDVDVIGVQQRQQRPADNVLVRKAEQPRGRWRLPPDDEIIVEDQCHIARSGEQRPEMRPLHRQSRGVPPDVDRRERLAHRDKAHPNDAERDRGVVKGAFLDEVVPSRDDRGGKRGREQRVSREAPVVLHRNRVGGVLDDRGGSEPGQTWPDGEQRTASDQPRSGDGEVQPDGEAGLAKDRGGGAAPCRDPDPVMVGRPQAGDRRCPERDAAQQRDRDRSAPPAERRDHQHPGDEEDAATDGDPVQQPPGAGHDGRRGSWQEQQPDQENAHREEQPDVRDLHRQRNVHDHRLPRDQVGEARADRRCRRDDRATGQ